VKAGVRDNPVQFGKALVVITSSKKKEGDRYLSPFFLTFPCSDIKFRNMEFSYHKKIPVILYLHYVSRIKEAQ